MSQQAGPVHDPESSASPHVYAEVVAHRPVVNAASPWHHKHAAQPLWQGHHVCVPPQNAIVTRGAQACGQKLKGQLAALHTP